MPVRNSLTIIIAAVVSLTCYEKATRNRYASTISLAMDIIENNYVEEVKPRELFENAMRGMVNELDEYSDYYGPEYYQRFQQSIDQQFVGIGVSVEGPPDSPELRVASPVYNSPAYRAGMRRGLHSGDRWDLDGWNAADRCGQDDERAAEHANRACHPSR